MHREGWRSDVSPQGPVVQGSRYAEERKEPMENKPSFLPREERSNSGSRPRRGRGLILQGVVYLGAAIITACLAVSGRALWLVPAILATLGLVALLVGVIRRYPG
jgi:hypothetical protein